MTSEKFDSIVSMLIDKRNSGKIFNTNDDVGKVNEYFMNDKALFISTVVGRLFAFRDMKTDFGVIPTRSMTRRRTDITQASSTRGSMSFR